MIRKMLNPGSNSHNMSFMLLIVRVAVGVLMLTHGLGKLEKLFAGGPIQFSDPLGVGATTSLVMAVFSEVFCSFLIIFGLATRFAAIPLLVTMLVAAFIVHANDPFVRQELPMLYATIYLVLTVTGAGKISIDQLIFKKAKK